MYPVRLSPTAGILPWSDHASASPADFAWSVSKVIFTGRTVVLVEVDVRKCHAFPRWGRDSHLCSRQLSRKVAMCS